MLWGLGGLDSNCSASLGPMVEKKVLIKLGVSSGLTGKPSSSTRWMSDLGADLLTSELTSCQNFQGLSCRFASLSCMYARAFRIAFLASVLKSRALGRRWFFPLRRASWSNESRSSNPSWLH